MKKYDRVFSENRLLKEDEIQDLDEIFNLQQHTSTVLVTIEELRDIWDAADENGRNAIRTFPNSKQTNLEEYLKQNGIEL